jgi:hypothetical protein
LYKRKGKKPRTVLKACSWAGLPLLEVARRLNVRGVGLLTLRTAKEGIRQDYAAVYGEEQLWGQIDARALERMARCPMVLFDLQFDDLEWWLWAQRCLTGPVAMHEPATFFTREEAAPFVRELLTEAWTLARSQPRAAYLIFGMTPAVSRAIAELSLQDLDAIAVRNAPRLTPRWHECRPFWAKLLSAAVGTDDDALTAVHLHCVQLLGGANGACHG